MAQNLAYYYARINTSTGMCVGIKDTTDLILSPDHVPIDVYTLNYTFKYYYPVPTSVTSFDDFQGQWYTSADHTTIFDPNA